MTHDIEDLTFCFHLFHLGFTNHLESFKQELFVELIVLFFESARFNLAEDHLKLIIRHPLLKTDTASDYPGESFRADELARTTLVHNDAHEVTISLKDFKPDFVPPPFLAHGPSWIRMVCAVCAVYT